MKIKSRTTGDAVEELTRTMRLRHVHRALAELDSLRVSKVHEEQAGLLVVDVKEDVTAEPVKMLNQYFQDRKYFAIAEPA